MNYLYINISHFVYPYFFWTYYNSIQKSCLSRMLLIHVWNVFLIQILTNLFLIHSILFKAFFFIYKMELFSWLTWNKQFVRTITKRSACGCPNKYSGLFPNKILIRLVRNYLVYLDGASGFILFFIRNKS